MRAIFYLLEDNTLKARNIYICRLVAKAYAKKHQVYILTTSAQESQDLDTQLWTFDDISFIPHSIGTPDSHSNQILIGTLDPPREQNDMLINLTPNVPSCYQQCQHIITILPNDEALRSIGRKHYQYYKQHGLEVITHNITQNSLHA